jgi:hypothetical protein
MRDINVPCFQSDINRCKTRQFLPAYKLGTDPLLSAQTHILSKNEALNLHLGGADRDKKVRSNSVRSRQLYYTRRLSVYPLAVAHCKAAAAAATPAAILRKKCLPRLGREICQ